MDKKKIKDDVTNKNSSNKMLKSLTLTPYDNKKEIKIKDGKEIKKVSKLGSQKNIDRSITFTPKKLDSDIKLTNLTNISDSDKKDNLILTLEKEITNLKKVYSLIIKEIRRS